MKWFYILIVICVIACATAYVSGQIYDMRYITNIQDSGSDNLNVTIRVFDTWKKEISCYRHYWNTKKQEWVMEWFTNGMTEVAK